MGQYVYYAGLRRFECTDDADALVDIYADGLLGHPAV